MDLDEKSIARNTERLADNYFESYREQILALEKSPLSKVRNIDMYEVCALGDKLAAWSLLQEMCEADNTVADLGILPGIALDVIAIAHGISPISIIASEQTIDNELGVILYKQIKAGNTAGNMTAGDTIASAISGMTTVPSGYSSASVTNENWGTGNGATTNFTGTALNLPLRPGSVTITATVSAATVTGNDKDGDGKIYGAGIADGSTIDYVTGAYDITFTTAPDNTTQVNGNYSVNLEGASDINSIEDDYAQKSVKAIPHALKGTMGLLKSFKLRKYGISAEDDMAKSLINAINDEKFGEAIRAMVGAAVGNTQWDSTTPTGISEEAHRKSFKFKLAEAESTLVGNAGRGTISYYVGGRTFCEHASTSPGWKKLYDGNEIQGAHLHGTLDDIPVVRVPADTTMIPVNKAVCGFRGMSRFEAAVVNATFMPLISTQLLPTGNPLSQQKAVADWSKLEVVVAKFLTMFEIT